MTLAQALVDSVAIVCVTIVTLGIIGQIANANRRKDKDKHD